MVWPRLLQTRKQGRTWLRRGSEQQDTTHAASSLRVSRPGIPPTESADLNAATDLRKNYQFSTTRFHDDPENMGIPTKSRLKLRSIHKSRNAADSKTSSSLNDDR